MNPLPFFLFSALFISTFQGVSAVPHVVHISVDGLASVYLKDYLETSPEGFSTFIRLKSEGSYTFNARCDFTRSETIPNHTSMFTGRPVEQSEGMPPSLHHGFINNSPPDDWTYHTHGNTNAGYKASVFDVAHDYGFATALFAGKTKMAICDRSYTDITGWPDLIGRDDGRDKIDVSLVREYYGVAMIQEVDAFVEHLQNEVPRSYSFIHLAEPDLTGHELGWGTAPWSNMVRQVDIQLSRILGAINENPLMTNRTIVIVTTDHGGGGIWWWSHSEPEYPGNYTIPFFVWGPGVPAGVDLYNLFANRRDPGVERPDFNAYPQPIRNGDSGNLALGLLGLPSIPGSLMRPLFAPPLVQLGLSKGTNGVVLTWPRVANDLVLEYKADLSQNWRLIFDNINQTDLLNIFQWDDTQTRAAFFRLRPDF